VRRNTTFPANVIRDSVISNWNDTWQPLCSSFVRRNCWQHFTTTYCYTHFAKTL